MEQKIKKIKKFCVLILNVSIALLVFSFVMTDLQDQNGWLMMGWDYLKYLYDITFGETQRLSRLPISKLTLCDLFFLIQAPLYTYALGWFIVGVYKEYKEEAEEFCDYS